MLKHAYDCVPHERSRLRPPNHSDDGPRASRPLALAAEGHQSDAKLVGGAGSAIRTPRREGARVPDVRSLGPSKRGPDLGWGLGFTCPDLTGSSATILGPSGECEARMRAGRIAGGYCPSLAILSCDRVSAL